MKHQTEWKQKKKERGKFTMAQRYVDLYRHLHPPFEKNETKELSSKKGTTKTESTIDESKEQKPTDSHSKKGNRLEKSCEGKKEDERKYSTKKIEQTRIHQPDQSKQKIKEVIIKCQKCNQEVENGNHSKFACALNCHKKVLRKFNNQGRIHKQKIHPIKRN